MVVLLKAESLQTTADPNYFESDSTKIACSKTTHIKTGRNSKDM